jgi:3'-phosphoadenosine 5'-phosphosulfate sulfotransferase (PAPS reductase)/FAD synthetase
MAAKAVAVLDGPPDMTWYDIIMVSTSGGKDSQTIMRQVAQRAKALGIMDRVFAIHSNLGPRVEWPGAAEIVAEQARLNGVREVFYVEREGGVATTKSAMYEVGEVWGDLLDMVERKGKWPSNGQRYCTSDFKRGPILARYTEIAKAWQKAQHTKRPCRILEVLGLRAEESAGRAKRPEYYTRRDSYWQRVDTWLPIKYWTTEQVWADICESRIPYHWAYDVGMERFSCMFCIYAKLHEMVAAGFQMPDKLQEWVDVEAGNRTPTYDGTLTTDLSLAEVQAELQRYWDEGLTPKKVGVCGCKPNDPTYGAPGEWVILECYRPKSSNEKNYLREDGLSEEEAANTISDFAAEHPELEADLDVPYPAVWIEKDNKGVKGIRALCAFPADSGQWPTKGTEWPWSKQWPKPKRKPRKRK